LPQPEAQQLSGKNKPAHWPVYLFLHFLQSPQRMPTLLLHDIADVPVVLDTA
jgi:hypothetical protein